MQCARRACRLGRRAHTQAAWTSPRREIVMAAEGRRISRRRDLHLTVLDPHRVRLELDRAVELVLAGAHVVLPAVPRAAHHVALEVTLAKRALQVDAVAVERVDLVPDAGQRELLLAGARTGERTGLELVQARDCLELGHGLDPSAAGCYG